MQPTAVFLDRDGTMIVEREYLSSPDQVELLPGVAEAVRMLNANGIPAIVITNQAGVARGLFEEAAIPRVHARIDELLAAEGAKIDAWYYCPHHPEGTIAEYRQACECRKPGTGMLRRAADDFQIDLTRSYIVGDKLSDVRAGLAADVSPILVRTGYGQSEESRLAEHAPHVRVENDLLSAVSWYLSRSDS